MLRLELATDIKKKTKLYITCIAQKVHTRPVLKTSPRMKKNIIIITQTGRTDTRAGNKNNKTKKRPPGLKRVYVTLRLCEYVRWLLKSFWHVNIEQKSSIRLMLTKTALKMMMMMMTKQIQ